MRRHRPGVIGTVAAALLVSFVSSAAAVPGALDPTLGHRGIVAEPYGNWVAGVAAAVQRNGRIVTAGETQLASGKYELVSTRMLPSGRLDSSYGDNGWVALSLGGTGGGDALVIQHNGDILIAGSGRSASHGPLAFAAVRLRPNGQLDKSFGTQGIATVAIGSEAIANAIALQPDGKIVLGGTANVSHPRFAIARLNADGSLDGTFGEGGITTFHQYAADWGMGVRPDGTIVLAGEYSPNGSGLQGLLGNLGLGPLGRKLGNAEQYLAAAVLPDGQPDSSFGRGGVVALAIGKTALCTAIAVQPDGKVILAGSAFTHTGVAATVRLMPNGSLDSGFGVAGISYQPLYDPINAVALQPDGKILVAATGPTLIRLDATGVPDPTFAADGIDRINQVSGNAANGVTFDNANGDIVLTGTATLSGRMELSVVTVRGS